MTTGIYARDYRVSVATPFGSALVGSLENKSWNGADWPKVSKRDPFAYNQSLDRIRHPDGSVHWRKYKRPDSGPARSNKVEHAYYSQIIRVEDPLFDYYDSNANLLGWGNSTNLFGGLQSPSSTWDNNHMLKLIGKLRGQIVGSDFNAAVFLAEGNQALKMIATNATKIYHAYKLARKGNILGAAGVLGVGAHTTTRLGKKSLARNWLELQYGWKPLLQDVYGGAEFLAHQLNTPLRQVYHSNLRVRTRGPALSWLTASPAFFEIVSKDLLEAGHIKAIISEVDVYAMAGLKDPLSVAWELLPFSFVADWFLPIGDWLSNRGLSSALTGTFVTSRYNCWHAHGVQSSTPDFICSKESLGYDFRQGITSRTVSSSLDVPLPTFKPLAKAASWMHCANAVALVTSLRR